MILWGLWTRRNKNFHGQPDGRDREVDVAAKHVLAEYHMANQKDMSRAGAVQERKATIWAKPQLHQVKVNCDASWIKESGKVGLGFVARNYNGEVLLSGARGECFASSPLEAEAKAIMWAMSHARSRSYPNVVFESDSQFLVNALRSGSTPLQIANMFSQILSFSLAFGTCQWSFVKREGNEVAHSIATWALGCNGLFLRVEFQILNKIIPLLSKK